MKAEHLRFAEVADHRSVVRAGERVSGVEDQFEVAGARDVFQCAHIASPAPRVHADDPGGARRDQFFDSVWIDRVSVGVYVTEDRRDLLPLKRVRGCDKGERRDDYFACEFERKIFACCRIKSK